MSMKYLMLLFATMIIRSFADSGNAIETTSPEITNTTTDIPAIRLCGPEGDGYCLHGDCIHARDINGMYCRCSHGYTGIRCQHVVLVDYQRSEKPNTTTSYIPSPGIVLVLVGIIMCCLLSVYRFTRRTNKLPLQDMVVP
ncbi:putative vaccinia growth factor [Camelpox virus]|uniref:Growth factor n=3 Tax=Camelpox virus TaxID=28873 RepID=VGF_CAMPM|nr:epidermal growth factor-like protein (EGF-like protein) [Camelpox virus]Q776B5.1 RecName: Full=Growth factor; AltName: Full=Secreted epidermal growth factor-like; Flags: Precursor [Camelpox virus CMS]Q8V307.1 RecName: Full=Growth factor; AltName: Full=Secreted epidermal growth factor-like; Flags: Precursor [Camelpox virus M-96]AAG37467.1 CMP11R [Camelpox virus CMS]AAL73717.1 putative vaccinia growth factor [Camelpox virus M-96]AKU40370.1 pro-vaccinia growth factor precursor [Camelpox virus]